MYDNISYTYMTICIAVTRLGLQWFMAQHISNTPRVTAMHIVMHVSRQRALATSGAMHICVCIALPRGVPIVNTRMVASIMLLTIISTYCQYKNTNCQYKNVLPIVNTNVPIVNTRYLLCCQYKNGRILMLLTEKSSARPQWRSGKPEREGWGGGGEREGGSKGEEGGRDREGGGGGSIEREGGR